MKLAALVFTIALALAAAGCAGMAQYPTGIPASSSPKFYAAMELVASERGMTVIKQPTSLNVKTAQGDWLQYMQQSGVINLVVIADTEGLDDAAIEERKAELKRLSDELVSEAAKHAAETRAFD